MVLGGVDGALDGAFQCATDTFEHAIEGGQLTDWLVIDGHGHFAKYAEHGALAHRVGLALKAVVHGYSTNSRLEQRELVRHEWVAVGEVLQIAEVLIVLAAVGKLEEGFEIVELLFVDGFQQLRTSIVLGQQALLDHLSHVGTG
ncbi:hypothetical protein D3C80_1425160 [compost metagenome]